MTSGSKNYYSHPWNSGQAAQPVPPEAVLADRDIRNAVRRTPIENVLGDPPAHYRRAEQRLPTPAQRINATLGIGVVTSRRPRLGVSMFSQGHYVGVSLPRVSMQEADPV